MRNRFEKQEREAERYGAGKKKERMGRNFCEERGKKSK